MADVQLEIKNKVYEVYQQLVDIKESDALNLVNWLVQKCRHIKRIQKGKFKRLPNNLIRGDIVNVEFGINIGNELSDSNTNGHYAIIWAQQGFTFLVIPLTKKQQVNNLFSENIGEIEGLPVKIDSYVKVDYMKWISSTRIRWINEQSDGKIVIKDEKRLANILTKIKGIMSNTLLND